MANPNRMDTKRLALSSLLLSIALVLGFVESLIPIAPGIPGIKLGLSNVTLLIALYMLGNVNAFALMGLKVMLSGLLFGGVSAMMYGLAGGVLSMLGMISVRKIKGVSVIGVSVVGAVLHNVGQVGLAMLIVKLDQLLYYMAILMLVGVGTGILTGTAAMYAMRSLKGPWAKGMLKDD